MRNKGLDGNLDKVDCGPFMLGMISGKEIPLPNGQKVVLGVNREESPNLLFDLLSNGAMETLRKFYDILGSQESKAIDPYANPRNIAFGRPVKLNTTSGMRYLGIPQIKK